MRTVGYVSSVIADLVFQSRAAELLRSGETRGVQALLTGSAFPL